jgi:hypothetical protein
MKYFSDRNEDEGSFRKTKVIFLTRFSILDVDEKSFLQWVQNRKEQHAMELFSASRLDTRFEIFEKSCLSSITRQDYDHLEWYLMTSNYLPEKYSQRLHHLVQSFPNIHIVPVENFAGFHQSINTILDKEPNYISVRLDDDDGLAPTFASRLVKIAKNNSDAEVISFTRGRKCSLSKTGEMIISPKPVYYPRSAQGLAAVNRNIYELGNHTKVHEKNVVHYDETPNMYNVFCSEWTLSKRSFK